MGKIQTGMEEFTAADIHVPDDLQTAVAIYVDDILPGENQSAIGFYFSMMQTKFPGVDINKAVNDYSESRKKM